MGHFCVIQAFKESKEVAIIAIVIVNAVIGFAQEYRGCKAGIGTGRTLQQRISEKGAPDVILKDCAEIYSKGVLRDLTEKDVQSITQENNRMAGVTLRVFGVAFKPMEQKDNSRVGWVERK